MAENSLLPNRRALPRLHCMNQPWLTTSDWPVRAFDSNTAKNSAASATSSPVVNSPSTGLLQHHLADHLLLGDAQLLRLLRDLFVHERRSVLPGTRYPTKDVAVDRHMADGRERQMSGHQRLAVRRQLPQ
jgi:hypothetical protein